MNWFRQVARKLKSFRHSDIPKSWPINWFQKGYTIPESHWDTFGAIYACMSVISQEISRIHPRHIRKLDNGGQEIITTSAASRILVKPNSYQTRSDFFLNMTLGLLSDGNAYAFAERNQRREPESLWPINPRNCAPYIEPESGSVFYQIGEDPWSQIGQIDASRMIPAREILHIRLETKQNPLIGVSRMRAAELPAITGLAIQRNSAAFFGNKAQPGGYIRVPGRLDKDTAKQLQTMWEESYGTENIGRVAILGAEAQYHPLTMTAEDAQIAEQYKLSIEDVARVFRVPPFLLGNLEHATLTNVEVLNRFFVTSGLGFYVNHWEESLTRFFRLPSTERIEFDVEQALLKADFQTRMDAYSKGIQSGVYSPNEARKRENLAEVENGDEPRVQQQLVPLSWGTEQQSNEEPEPEPEPINEERAANIVYMALRKQL